MGNCFEKENLSGNEKCYYKKVHGQWSEWGGWGECTPFCEGSWKKRERKCNNPPPQFHGNDCLDKNNQYIGCRLKLLKSGQLFKEHKTLVVVDKILATSVTKIQCILKCQVKEMCHRAGFIGSSKNNKLGVCYSTFIEVNKIGDSRDLVLFDDVLAVKPGTSETEGLRGLC